MRSNLILYVVYFIWFKIMYKYINSKSLMFHQIFSVILSLAGFVNAQYAYVLTFSEKVQKWADEYKLVNETNSD